ncbi:MAG: hypothetical protein V1875_03180 [Candidatus Altiarchaeota archaeon]
MEKTKIPVVAIPDLDKNIEEVAATRIAKISSGGWGAFIFKATLWTGGIAAALYGINAIAHRTGTSTNITSPPVASATATSAVERMLKALDEYVFESGSYKEFSVDVGKKTGYTKHRDDKDPSSKGGEVADVQVDPGSGCIIVKTRYTMNGRTNVTTHTLTPQSDSSIRRSYTTEGRGSGQDLLVAVSKKAKTEDSKASDIPSGSGKKAAEAAKDGADAKAGGKAAEAGDTTILEPVNSFIVSPLARELINKLNVGTYAGKDHSLIDVSVNTLNGKITGRIKNRADKSPDSFGQVTDGRVEGDNVIYTTTYTLDGRTYVTTNTLTDLGDAGIRRDYETKGGGRGSDTIRKVRGRENISD